jgi:hypothetical protein
LGEATFVFEQSSTADLSDESGNAFAAGTTSRFDVTMNDGSVLPAAEPESSDPAVFSASRVAGTPPFRAVFEREGVAILRVRRSEGGDAIDEVALRVAEPRAMRLATAGEFEPLIGGGGLFGEPERVVIVPGATCRLYVHLTDGAETALWGVFSPTVSGVSFLEIEEGGMVAASLDGDPVHARLTIEATAEGSGTLRLQGPRGLARAVEFSATEDPEVGAIDAVLWPGYTTSWEVGETTLVTAAFRTSDGDPVYGAGATFASDDPAVLRVTPLTGAAALAGIEFLAVGSARLTACSTGTPPICDSIDLEVVPLTAED